MKFYHFSVADKHLVSSSNSSLPGGNIKEINSLKASFFSEDF